MMLLPAGRYAIEGRYGVSEGSPSGTVRIATTCLNREENSVVMTVPLSRANGRFRHRFEIGAGCPAQWFSIGLQNDDGAGGATIWLDDLRLSRS